VQPTKPDLRETTWMNTAFRGLGWGNRLTDHAIASVATARNCGPCAGDGGEKFIPSNELNSVAVLCIKIYKLSHCSKESITDKSQHYTFQGVNRMKLSKQTSAFEIANCHTLTLIRTLCYFVCQHNMKIPKLGTCVRKQ